MADTTYAPSITHITDKHLWMYPLKHEICGRETVCNGKYKKTGVKKMKLDYSLSVWSPSPLPRGK